MKRSLRILAVALLTGLILSVPLNWWSGYYRPPHAKAFERLKREVYAEYLRIGDMPPNLEFLSAESKSLLAAPNGVTATWNETEKSLH